jgi:hypothetical protein
MNSQIEISKSRLIIASAIIILSLGSAAFIPLVLMLPISSELKTTLSGLLVLGIPQGLTAIAIAVVGKSGYQYLKQLFFKLIKSNMPPDQVSKTRYNLGLVMFVIPLVLAWAHPVALHFFPEIQTFPVWLFFCLDALLISSFFVLGGDFWDKLRGLFNYDIQVAIESHK